MDVEDLFPQIRRQIRGCPEDSMSFALIQAARELCAESWWLRRTMQGTTVQGQMMYPAQPPANEEVVALKHGQIYSLPPNQNVSPLRFVYPTLINPNIGQQMPYGICFVPNDTIALIPPADNAYAFQVEMITQPILGSAYVPDEIGRLWDRALGYGALSFLYITNPTDAWYNPQMADRMLKMFNQEIVKARTQAAFDFTPNQKQWIGGNFAQLTSSRW